MTVHEVRPDVLDRLMEAMAEVINEPGLTIAEQTGATISFALQLFISAADEMRDEDAIAASLKNIAADLSVVFTRMAEAPIGEWKAIAFDHARQTQEIYRQARRGDYRQ